MNIIIEKERCSGCGACLASCPKEAISMQRDSEGFDFPHIDQTLCIDCGLCQKVCPPLHYEERTDKRLKKNSVQRGFAARNKNYEQRLISSSGSIFAVLAQYVLSMGGAVVGVAYDDIFNAEYKIIESDAELPLIQGSKYLQCKPSREIFKKIREILKTGRIVLFSGLACQVEGLHTFLRKDYDNLVCIDLICMGIPSAEVWQIYLNTYFKGEKILNVNFKEKSVGWNHFNLAITTDKQDFKQWGMINPYFKSMFNTYNMRRSCFVCPFKRIEREADITLADCWGASRLVPQIDDNKGLSSVIVHSDKGLSLWSEVASMVDCVELPLEEIISGNTNMIENRTCDYKNRRVFYKLLLSKHPQKAFQFAERQGVAKKPNISRRIINKLKSILKKLFRS